MTTNCIQRPKDSYRQNIFQFAALIERALELPGFATDRDGGTVTVGFGRNTVLGVADRVIEAVKNRVIRHFFLVAGCDGAKPGRNYYTEFV